MRFKKLTIQNLRGIDSIDLDDLSGVVVIAGPNGSGKSTLLDAVRLLKSAYGGYSDDEVAKWAQEFQINRSSNEHLARDPENPVQVSAVFELAAQERSYLEANLTAMCEEFIWKALTSNSEDVVDRVGIAPATEQRMHHDDVRKQAGEHEKRLRSLLWNDHYEIGLTVGTDGQVMTVQNELAEMIFQTYAPQDLGVIDFYSANRSYPKESVTTVKVTTEQPKDRRGAQLLSDHEQKHQGIKAELATSYVTELIAREAGAPPGDSSLQNVLGELFEIFFDGKQFKGVVPSTDGSPTFPVHLADDRSHDIDLLSSGEKEVVYGYLRLRNANLRHSVLLFDEPELHLNPRLALGLPEFYRRHIGEAMDNQVWLVTHSDALLKEAVNRPGFSVFHLREAGNGYENQAVSLGNPTSFDQAVLDLVGDVASFRPGAPLLLLEGGGEHPFDVHIVKTVVPDLVEGINFAAAGNKRAVKELRALLSDGANVGSVIASDVRAIVDRDSDRGTGDGLPGVAAWDRYHIENYLLWPEGIAQIVSALDPRTQVSSPQRVYDELRRIARELIPARVAHELRREVDGRLRQTLKLKTDSGLPGDPSQGLSDSLEATAIRFNQEVQDIQDEMTEMANRFSEELYSSLENDEWMAVLPGREILNRFGRDFLSVDGRSFLRLIVDRMATHQYRPEGMVQTLTSVLADVR